jgi:hypothetical protein
MQTEDDEGDEDEEGIALLVFIVLIVNSRNPPRNRLF